MNGALRYALVATLPMLLILLALGVLNPAGDYWKAVEPPKAQCEAYDPVRLRTLPAATAEVYDQRRLDRLMREPQNTISNLAYAIAGLAIILAGNHPVSRSLGVAAVFLGVGSGMYHLTLLPEWRLIDILGVYAVLYCLVFLGIAVNIHRAKHWTPWWALIAAVWLVAIYTGVHRNDIRWLGVKWFDSTYVFVAAALAGGVLAVVASRITRDRKQYVRTAAVLAIAAGISFTGGLGDRFGGFWANPDALIQGHAVWHTFGAVALLAAYELYATTGFDHSTISRNSFRRCEPAEGHAALGGPGRATKICRPRI